MKSHMLIKAFLLAATCLLLPPQPAIGDDFVPLRIVPKVRIEFGRTEVDLDVTKIGSRQAAANQKLDVRIQELGNLPGFKVYKSVANFILIKYPLEIKDALMEALKVQDYKI